MTPATMMQDIRRLPLKIVAVIAMAPPGGGRLYREDQGVGRRPSTRPGRPDAPA